MSEPIPVLCPCCGTKMAVDRDTGDVLSEERPRDKPTRSFEDALGEVHHGAQRRQDLFAQAFDKTKRLDTILDRKFEEARKKAKEDPDKKPTNPFDLE
jgi:hypothetical protein